MKQIPEDGLTNVEFGRGPVVPVLWSRRLTGKSDTIHFKDPFCSREDLWPVETHRALGTGRPQAPLACGLLCDAHRTLQRSEPSVLSDEHKDHRTQWCRRDR